MAEDLRKQLGKARAEEAEALASYAEEDHAKITRTYLQKVQ